MSTGMSRVLGHAVRKAVYMLSVILQGTPLDSSNGRVGKLKMP
jgi:hypothetical protein